MKHLLLLLAILLMPPVAGAQSQRVPVMFWNVENLFDCRHDTLRNDYEFLPEGSHHWTPYRYWHKLDNIARTVAAVAETDGDWPALVGMAEVENDSCLFDLTRRSPLRMAGYRYVITESADARGIDLGLLYQPERFRLVSWHAVRVPSRQNGLSPTRDILYVCGETSPGDTLHVVVVHLPSRAGKKRGSERHRRLAAETLRHVVDSLGDRRLIVMGDFNTARPAFPFPLPSAPEPDATNQTRTAARTGNLRLSGSVELPRPHVGLALVAAERRWRQGRPPALSLLAERKRPALAHLPRTGLCGRL